MTKRSADDRYTTPSSAPTAPAGRPHQQSPPRQRVNTVAARRATGGGEGVGCALLASWGSEIGNTPGAADRRGTRPRRRARHPDEGAALPQSRWCPRARTRGGAWFPRLARPCPPTATPDELSGGDGMGDTVVPTRRRAVESGAGTHTRGVTRGPRAAVHSPKSHLPSESVGQPFAGSLDASNAHQPPENQKTKTNLGQIRGVLDARRARRGAFRAAENRGGD